jgi:hypothetical protein
LGNLKSITSNTELKGIVSKDWGGRPADGFIGYTESQNYFHMFIFNFLNSVLDLTF